MSDNMSDADSEDPNILLQTLACIFTPVLRDRASQPIPPYDTVVPLTEIDFASHPSVGLTHLSDLASIHATIVPGFAEGAPLNREQWLRTAAQLNASILKGFSQSCPDNECPDFMDDINPDERAALHTLGQVVGSLNYYFTNPAAKEPTKWKQCLRCLKVNHITITPEYWESQLQHCQQMVDATRETILNIKTREFEKEIMSWVDSQCATAFNQVVEVVLDSNHPPPETDPRMTEWITRRAEELKQKAESDAIKSAKRNARTLYNQQRHIVEKDLEADLQAIKDNGEAQRAQARAQEDQLIAEFKANL